MNNADPTAPMTDAQRAFRDAEYEIETRNAVIKRLSKSIISDQFVSFVAAANGGEAPWSDSHKAGAERHDMTPEAYAIAIMEESFEDMLEPLKRPEDAARDEEF